MTILVTGGAGFIGANFVLDWIRDVRDKVVNLDLLTYAGNLGNLDAVHWNPQHLLVRGNIGDSDLVAALLRDHKPRAIVHFAAESHVDRSIHGPEEFIKTNIVGTSCLLKAALEYWRELPESDQATFRFLNVSTDEVYGSLGPDDPAFSEITPYAPNSPYSASKAASDHLVRAYFHTYGIPVLTTNCSNNYGPFQFPEKLIPLVILNAISGRSLPIYGDGLNVRDWLNVTDHCDAIRLVLAEGRPGETYNIGGRSEKTNIDVVKAVCRLLDELHPKSPKTPHASLITYVKDRPGHDRRYAIDASKIEHELNWRPKESFETGLRKTVEWYLDNRSWIGGVTSGQYRSWVDMNYGARDVVS